MLVERLNIRTKRIQRTVINLKLSENLFQSIDRSIGRQDQNDKSGSINVLKIL